MAKKTDFDQYVEEITQKYPAVKKELAKAERAWDIAFQIKELRKKRDLTQKQLATLARTSQPSVARIENADYQGYTLKTLKKVAKALDSYIDVVIIPEEKIEEHKKHFPRPVFAIPAAA